MIPITIHKDTIVSSLTPLAKIRPVQNQISKLDVAFRAPEEETLTEEVQPELMPKHTWLL
ncbi:unnamed protein product [Arabidopsis lyrata]|nr:unnamed protein product [Arabidopsis lyrata]